MLVLNSRIEIDTFDGQTYIIENPVDISIRSTYKTLTDTAMIKIPSRYRLNGQFISVFNDNNTISQGDNALFKIGQKVRVYLGYTEQVPNLTLVYEGFIRAINNETPVEIELDDYMYLLKKSRANISLKDATISEYVEELLTTAGWAKFASSEDEDPFQYSKEFNGTRENIKVIYTDPNTKIGKIRTKNSPSIADVFGKNEIFSFFFRGNNLYVVLPQVQSISDTQEHDIFYEEKVIDSDLFYSRDEDILYSVTVKSFVDNNKYIELKVGDEDGENRDFFVFDIEDEEELRLIGEEQLAKIKKTGFKGSFLTFGDPIIRHLDTVNVVRSRLTNQGVGSFLVDKVITEFGQGGFKQEVFLGNRLA